MIDRLPRFPEMWQQITHPVTPEDYAMAGVCTLVIIVVLWGLWRIFSNDS